MRILIISHNFPPHTTPGALRVGKTAKYLKRLGHEVRVIAADDPSRLSGTTLEISPENVTYTPWLKVNALPERFAGGKAAAGVLLDDRSSRGPRAWLRQLGVLYKTFANVPDSAVGWLPYAVAAGRRVIVEWRPDILLASAPPFTAHLAAALLARMWRVPWVADLRDPWVGYHEYGGARMREAVDGWLEQRVLSSAAQIVTVSEPIAEELRSRHSTPVAVVTNGFDAVDYDFPRPDRVDERLEILYTGYAHPGKRDPTTFFEALASLGSAERHLRVAFYGRRLRWVRDLAERHGVGEVVQVHDAIPHVECTRLQRRADVLLFLVWTDPAGVGNVSSKIFDYAGARRPILAVGPADNEASRIIREHGLGVVEESSATIAAYLEKLIAGGSDIPDLPLEAAQSFTREAQTKTLEELLRRVVRLHQ